MEMALQIYHKRKLIFNQSCPPCMIRYNITIEKSIHIINQIEQLDQNHQQFCYDLFVQLSGCWEAFYLNSFGQRRFQQSLQSSLDFEENIYQSLDVFQHAAFPVTFYKVKQQVIENIKQNIKKNITLVREILRNNIDLQVIDNFFEDQIFLIFQSKWLSSDLQGVTSFDGKRCYISSQIGLDNYLRIFEVQTINNLSIWFVNNQNPYLIIWEQNSHLTDRHGNLLEPGDYYLIKAYNQHITNPGPFKMGLRNCQLTFAL